MGEFFQRERTRVKDNNLANRLGPSDKEWFKQKTQVYAKVDHIMVFILLTRLTDFNEKQILPNSCHTILTKMT